ncbi:MAG: oligosaccharide repeat unit polymerase family protein, partial [Euryarchaeota archaeon]|nr:oligosaccharide repeat unit polymerase family protein [Euryarchaeota archaeon]
FVFTLLGFRFEVTGILLIATIVSWYKKIINFREMILIFLFLIGLITIVGYIVKKAMMWQIWHLDPVQLLFYRAGFTLYVLGEIIKMSWPFGLTYGAASFGTPRAGEIVSEVVFGYKMSLTSTLIGPSMLDFGIIGVIITMIYLGGLSGFGYKLLSERNWFFIGVYAFLMSHLIIFIEAGPNFILWLITLLTMYLYSAGLCYVRNTY